MANEKNLKPFKKGQSGNPNGRPKKLPALDQLLAEVMGDDTEIAKKILISLTKRAQAGDVKAAALLFDRGWGKAKENEGKPTEMIINVLRNG